MTTETAARFATNAAAPVAAAQEALAALEQMFGYYAPLAPAAADAAAVDYDDYALAA